MEKYAIGIDIGGTTVAFGVVDERGTMVARSYFIEDEDTKEVEKKLEKYKIETQDYEKFDDFINILVKKLKLFLADNNLTENIIGIGIGAPNAQYSTGEIVNPVNLWKNDKSVEVRVFKIRDILSKEMNLDKENIVIDNDANAAAMGELLYGKAKEENIKNFIEITLGTGVGSGIVSNGALVRGNNGFAGELGHTVSIRHNGRLCGCGGRGHLETYASATGVACTAREFLETRKEYSVLREITQEKITSKDVFNAAKKGDKISLDIFEYTGKILGEAFADFIVFSDPEAIILFGGLTKSWNDYLKEPTERYMENALMPNFRGKVKLMLTGMKAADVAVLGASALVWEAIIFTKNKEQRIKNKE